MYRTCLHPLVSLSTFTAVSHAGIQCVLRITILCVLMFQRVACLKICVFTFFQFKLNSMREIGIILLIWFINYFINIIDISYPSLQLLGQLLVINGELTLLSATLLSTLAATFTSQKRCCKKIKVNEETYPTHMCRMDRVVTAAPVHAMQINSHSAPHWPGGESFQRICWIHIVMGGVIF